uniref:Transmembrane protein 182 n=1 Tax=Oncorhynchus tshawytscha TaxID=74940 RepID=A0A8C8GIT0_ONCTS
MKLSVLLFLAGFFRGLGALSLMLSFGTDYWLLTWEAGALRPGEREMEDQDTVTFFHQGFFWRCSFSGMREENMVWHFWITNQPHQKVCVPAYLFLIYASEQSTDYQAPDTAVYRAFWSIFLLVGVVTVMIGGFVIICASLLASHRLYKVGGALLLTGCRLSVVFLCSDIADACQILQCLSANHIIFYRNLMPDGIVDDVVCNHGLMHASSDQSRGTRPS